MDHLKLSSSMASQAQAMAAMHRTVAGWLENRFGKTVTVNAAELERLGACLRQGAELADAVSILHDEQVEVPVKV